MQTMFDNLEITSLFRLEGEFTDAEISEYNAANPDLAPKPWSRKLF